ncbi:hormone-sensitive lipase [Plakobranchus ocellatus]|uniref:Hormone-sensitive lipase n=1 Tax=Plakobranchus ocellatus TaxID=259542 RepID=A0AAV3YST2_9GAST|nr:hormone-sensitive lipase [Plakobranchus ocellatus]
MASTEAIFQDSASTLQWIPQLRQVLFSFEAFEFAIKCINALLYLSGSTGEKIIVTGDSAGGNLAISTAMRAASFGIRAPDGLVVVYPCTVVKYTPSPARLLSLMDPVLPVGLMARCLAAYAGIDEQEPLASPTMGELHSDKSLTSINMESYESADSDWIIVTQDEEEVSKIRSSAVDQDSLVIGPKSVVDSLEDSMEGNKNLGPSSSGRRHEGDTRRELLGKRGRSETVESEKEVQIFSQLVAEGSCIFPSEDCLSSAQMGKKHHVQAAESPSNPAASKSQMCGDLSETETGDSLDAVRGGANLEETVEVADDQSTGSDQTHKTSASSGISLLQNRAKQMMEGAQNMLTSLSSYMPSSHSIPSARSVMSTLAANLDQRSSTSAVFNTLHKSKSSSVIPSPPYSVTPSLPDPSIDPTAACEENTNQAVRISTDGKADTDPADPKHVSSTDLSSRLVSAEILNACDAALEESSCDVTEPPTGLSNLDGIDDLQDSELELTNAALVREAKAEPSPLTSSSSSGVFGTPFSTPVTPGAAVLPVKDGSSLSGSPVFLSDTSPLLLDERGQITETRSDELEITGLEGKQVHSQWPNPHINGNLKGVSGQPLDIENDNSQTDISPAQVDQPQVPKHDMSENSEPQEFVSGKVQYSNPHSSSQLKDVHMSIENDSCNHQIYNVYDAGNAGDDQLARKNNFPTLAASPATDQASSVFSTPLEVNTSSVVSKSFPRASERPSVPAEAKSDCQMVNSYEPFKDTQMSNKSESSLASPVAKTGLIPPARSTTSFLQSLDMLSPETSPAPTVIPPQQCQSSPSPLPSIICDAEAHDSSSASPASLPRESKELLEDALKSVDLGEIEDKVWQSDDNYENGSNEMDIANTDREPAIVRQDFGALVSPKCPQVHEPLSNTEAILKQGKLSQGLSNARDLEQTHNSSTLCNNNLENSDKDISSVNTTSLLPSENSRKVHPGSSGLPLLPEKMLNSNESKNCEQGDHCEMGSSPSHSQDMFMSCISENAANQGAATPSQQDQIDMESSASQEVNESQLCPQLPEQEPLDRSVPSAFEPLSSSHLPQHEYVESGLTSTHGLLSESLDFNLPSSPRQKRASPPNTLNIAQTACNSVPHSAKNLMQTTTTSADPKASGQLSTPTKPPALQPNCHPSLPSAVAKKSRDNQEKSSDSHVQLSPTPIVTFTPSEQGGKLRLWPLGVGTGMSPSDFEQQHFTGHSPLHLLRRAAVVKNPYMSPLTASDEMLQGLKRVSIVGCHLDPLLDDSVMFARRLRDLGIPVDLHLVDDLPHGFLNFALLSVEARQAADLCGRKISDMLSDSV